MLQSIIELLRQSINDTILKDPFWASVAIIGNVLFGGRFLIQWLASEYKQESYVPVSFWYISIAGSIALLAYMIHIKNIIFMGAFSVNSLIYIRNLQLIYRKKNTTDSPVQSAG